ncbi:hypothetical protein B0I35DRAFT_443293 [Stachybotrys elegans]|uniref:NAD(P)-binding protein n=1 Tax=Stachybotrys elegans TaxID=80388 RepID=A0A8K0SEZ1_9HYPO|nr:hypothetical protein B0I35DRAFT_443293 [Stachybotrys elegans]
MTTPTPVWFITASSSSFGHEIARIALERGHTVIATARNPSKIDDLAQLGAHTLAFDVTWPVAKIADVANDVYSKYGRVDYLINAAGFILDAAVEEVSPEEMYQSFNTNVFGIVNTIKSFLPGMRSQPVGPDGTRGTVVTFGSLGSWEGGASYALYGMAKASMSSLAESLAIELKPFNIVATVVEPGYFRTNFLGGDAMVHTKHALAAYNDENTPTGQVRTALKKIHQNQPGDVKKGCAVIVDILTKQGPAEGRQVPVRIVLGTDCDQTIRGKFKSTLAILDEWKDLINSTDHTTEQ